MRLTSSAASRPCGSVKYRFETWMSFSRLLDERLGDGRVRVAETAHGDARAEIEVTLARDIKQVTARAVAEHEVEAAIAGHDVLAEQFPHRLELVMNERRR